MELIKGQSYTCDATDLAIKVIANLYYSNSKRQYRFKGMLYNKKNGIVYETKNYKIDKDIPKKFNWRPFNG